MSNELLPNCYYYNELGLIYSDGYELETAIDAFKKALNMMKRTCILITMQDGHIKHWKFDDKYKYYKLAFEHRTNDDFITHRNLATYYRIMREYEKLLNL